MTRRKLHTKDPHILGTTRKNLDTTETWLCRISLTLFLFTLPWWHYLWPYSTDGSV